MSIATKYPNLVMRGAEFIPLMPEPDQIKNIPKGTRGVYALLKKKGSYYNVVYIGLAREGGGVRYRLYKHLREKDKKGEWTHFSFFEVWPNVPNKWIEEMEALFLHFFRRHDREHHQTLKLNKIMKAGRFKKVMFNGPRFEDFPQMELKDIIRPKKGKRS
jgi:hypothetical protein